MAQGAGRQADDSLDRARPYKGADLGVERFSSPLGGPSGHLVGRDTRQP